MRRASGLFVIALLAGTAIADDEPHGESHNIHESRITAAPREQLVEQLAAETDTLTRTRATVAEKLAAADAVRLRRLRAAYRILHAPLAPDASATDRLAAARRRAAARLLVARDRDERGLLASETAHLVASENATASATAKLPSITLPEDLARPATGSIVRHAGIVEHERSHAQLSRRGIDLEVADRAPVSAPADGIVRYAGPIRGLDQGVILDHGDYYTVLAKLDAPAIPVGAHVSRGDRIGRAAHHRVYMELRVKLGPGGLPIDPEPLLR